MNLKRFALRALFAILGLAAARFFAPWVCGRDARGWYDGDPDLQKELAEDLITFEERDDRHRVEASPQDRFAGEWALVTHEMTALGLGQLCLARSGWCDRYAPIATKAALKSFLPEMRDFGTRAWGEDAMSSLAAAHGHAYLAYSALAVGMARVVDPNFPASETAKHDALIAAYERRLLASPTGLIETYPGEAYPTDVAAVAAAIAVHGRATGVDHRRVLQHWASRVRALQIDPKSGLVIQRMSAANGKAHDVPRGSGTGLAAYYAGFADRGTAQLLTDALFQHESSFFGFSAIREFADGFHGSGRRGQRTGDPRRVGGGDRLRARTCARARAPRRVRAYLSHHRSVRASRIVRREAPLLRRGTDRQRALAGISDVGPGGATVSWKVQARPFVPIVLPVVSYVCLKAIFFALTGSVGLISPSGSPHLGLAALGLALLVLRIWVLFVVPAILVGRLARFLLARHMPPS
jgi:hypothetical protein